MVVSFKVSKIGTRYRSKTTVRLSEKDDEDSPIEEEAKVSHLELVILVQTDSPLFCVYWESLSDIIMMLI